LGADYYGVADLTPAREAIVAQGGPALADYARAVSLGVILMNDVVDLLPAHTEPSAALPYLHHVYRVVNTRLDDIALRTARVLQSAGYRTMPIPASLRVNQERLYGTMSNKLPAHLAGLGWIGKSALLITPANGPRVRWATVLTDAPLATTGSAMESRCGKCVECVEACPAKAFTGEQFRAGQPREAIFDAHKCKAYITGMERKAGEAACGMCVYVCPHGRKRSRNPDQK